MINNDQDNGIKLKYQIQKNDFLLFVWSDLVFGFKKYILILLYVGAIVSFCIVTYKFIIGDFNFSFYRFILYNSPLIFLILFSIFLFNSVVKNYTTDELIKEEIELSISNQEIQVKTVSTNSNFDWKKVFKAIEFNKLFGIYIANYKAIIIPKRLLDSEKIESLKSIISSSIEEKKIKFK